MLGREMSLEEFGPFGAIVTIALALIATFSLMLLKMFGGMTKWAGIAGEEAPFVVKTGARLLGIGVIAATFMTINKTNYHWFLGGAIAFGLIALLLLAKFDRLRKLHVRQVPVTGANGQQDGTKTIVIGTETTMRPDDRANYTAARRQQGGLSLVGFLAGYGANAMYDPETCWDTEVLAGVRSTLTMLLVWISVFGVLVLYLSASSIQIGMHTAGAG